MIGRLYRLMDVKRIEMVQRVVPATQDTVWVQPEYLAICAADQRYYLGQRKKEHLSRKLPMALIHEATGTVLHDFSRHMASGTKVVLIPLEPGSIDTDVKGNYRLDSRFASSGADGFMRDVVAIGRDRLVPVAEDYSLIYVFSELLSVAVGAVRAFEKTCLTGRDSFGVWGDGSMGFVTALVLRCLYPESKVYIFGKSVRKLQKFAFATRTFYIDQIPPNLTVNHSFECVGGMGSETAITQMIDLIRPQGCINLLGVSEERIPISTRDVLEKGLLLMGSSRSDAGDFHEAAALIRENALCRQYLHMLVSEVIEVRRESDIPYAFDQSVLNDFKTVMRWQI